MCRVMGRYSRYSRVGVQGYGVHGLGVRVRG